jgi:HlyD family secretion protein
MNRFTKQTVLSWVRNRFTRKTIFGVVVVAVVASAAFFYQFRGNRPATFFRTAQAKRGDLVATISATGTVEPEEVVDVGAQVAGQIMAFGKDKNGKTIDYGSVVEDGTVLAQIDDTLYAADVALVRAQLQQAKAGVQRAEADLGQLQAKLVQAEQDWNRARELGPSDALSQSDYDASRSAYEVAKANLEVGKVAIVQAKEAVSQAEAALRRAEQNLNYCTIKSPVKGVIIDRRVNIGQTVVASLNAPSLFLIAKDLKRLQVWVSVNEADIGNIRPGQAVTFTVDAYPGQVFKGEVGKVRLNATMTQNVVTYTVEIITDNSDGRLLPYLTANVKFLVSERRNVLLVPNAALRWIPQPDQVAPDKRGSSTASAEPKPRVGSAPDAGAEGQTRGVVWVPTGALVREVPVRVGLSDGAVTEVQDAGLQEGTSVVVGEQQKEAKSPASTNPFTPQFFRGSGQGQRQ